MATRGVRMDGFRRLPTGLVGLEAVTAESDHVFSRHSHDTYGIGLLVSGGQISASGRGQVEAHPGEIITVNPGEVHDGAPLGRRPRRWQMLYLEPDLALALCRDRVSATGGLEFDAPVLSDDRLRPLPAGLHRTLETTDPADAADAAMQALVLLLGATLRPCLTHNVAAPAALRKVQAFLHDDPAQAFDLSTLAAMAGLDRFQLIRAFRRLTGFTPQAYLLQRRASLCRHMLAGNLSLAEIAADCGYVDQSHMHREFKRRYGLTPGAYRLGRSGRPDRQTRGWSMIRSA